MNLFNRMLENERVAGVKCSSDPAQDILRFKHAGGKDFIVFNGPDEQFVAGRLLGADAGIGGTYGAMPELYLKGIITLDGCPMGDPRLPFLPVATDDPKLVELYHDIRKAVEDTKEW